MPVRQYSSFIVLVPESISILIWMRCKRHKYSINFFEEEYKCLGSSMYAKVYRRYTRYKRWPHHKSGCKQQFLQNNLIFRDAPEQNSRIPLVRFGGRKFPMCAAVVVQNRMEVRNICVPSVRCDKNNNNNNST